MKLRRLAAAVAALVALGITGAACGSADNGGVMEGGDDPVVTAGE